MRREPTVAERRLWAILRSRRFAGYKFRRQFEIGPYIVDFIWPSARLIVELDGSQHSESTYDKARDRWLCDQGYQVLRLWNDVVLAQPDVAQDAIFTHLEEHHHG